MNDKMYILIARSLEDDIISGAVREGGQAPSTNALADKFGVNPATAAKGVALLAQEGCLTKRRGVGLFVKPGARDTILERRKSEFRRGRLASLLEEAGKLGISKPDLIAMIMASHQQDL